VNAPAVTAKKMAIPENLWAIVMVIIHNPKIAGINPKKRLLNKTLSRGYHSLRTSGVAFNRNNKLLLGNANMLNSMRRTDVTAARSIK